MRRVELGISQRPERYEAHDIASLVVNSFRFSRGNAVCQDAILGYIATSFGSCFVLETFPDAVSQAQRKVLSTYNRLHISKNASESLVRSEAEDYTEMLKGFVFYPDKKMRASLLAEGITSQLIDSDYKWLPRTRHAEEKPPLPRPYNSNLVTYGFLDKSTGRPEFRAIFDFATRSILGGQLPKSDDLDWAENVVAEHYKYQPIDRVALQARLTDTVLESAIN